MKKVMIAPALVALGLAGSSFQGIDLSLLRGARTRSPKSRASRIVKSSFYPRRGFPASINRHTGLPHEHNRANARRQRQFAKQAAKNRL